MKQLKTITLFMIYLVIAISFSLYFPQEVSAAEQACCQRTKAGDYCRYTDIDDCNPSFLSAPNIYCDNVDYCKTGCCYDTLEGDCYSGVAKSACEAKPDSIFNPDPQCNIDQCRLGCCQISNQCSLATQAKCRATASKYPGVEMIFHPSIIDEQTCIDTCRGTEQGACVSQDGSCTRTPRADCTDTFYQGKLCSHPDLKTNCAPQQTTNCVGEDVYWFDSCGNQENIYNQNKRISYNSGYTQDEKQACPPNADPENCGNCDYITGTLCGKASGAEYGEYICKDMNCKNVYENSASPNSGGNKKHGESWCIYDSLPGPGRDVVGSRHRKHICLNGEEIIEECADYREEYCVQNKIGDEKLTDVSLLELISTDLQGYTEAICKPNNFEDCRSCPDLECCEDINKDCTWISYGDTGTFSQQGVCVPIVPPGLKFWETGESVCSQATQTCKVTYKRTELEAITGGDWDCEKNCHCETPAWTVAANEYCKTMGDCGAYYNVEGKATLGGYNLAGKARHRLSTSDLEAWGTLLSPDEDLWHAWGSETGNVLGVTLGLAAITYAIGTGLFLPAALAAVPAAGTFTGAEWLGLSYKSWVAPVLLWITFTVIVLSFIENKKIRTYTFVCEPWESPDGGKDCEKCNDLNIECTEYRCKSLGKNCELINEGEEEQKCISMPKTDVSSPQITPGQMDFQITPDPTIPTGFKIRDLVPPFTPIILKINTDEAAQCKYSEDPLQDYETMDSFGTSQYVFEREVLIPIPSEATTEEALLATNDARYELYIKCRDYQGNTNTKDYSIKFQIDPGPDQTPPSIEKTLPDNNAPIPYGQGEYEITALLNEPADCKWSFQDKDFTQMENTFTCAQTGFDISSFYYGLYECKTKLTDVKQNQLNTYYFRCQDKANNIQQQSFQYNLLSTPPLKIIDTKPIQKQYTRYPVIEATTAQGSDNGIAICGFNEKDVTLTNMIQMFNTDSTEHSQQLQPTQSGKYTYYIKCVDKAGNIAEDIITFELEISLEAPQIYNIYKNKALNILHISTTEATNCEYSQESFAFGTGTPMTQPDSNEHTATLGLNVYHIICQDRFDNQDSVIVYP